MVLSVADVYLIFYPMYLKHKADYLSRRAEVRELFEELVPRFIRSWRTYISRRRKKL